MPIIYQQRNRAVMSNKLTSIEGDHYRNPQVVKLGRTTDYSAQTQLIHPQSNYYPQGLGNI